MTGWLPDGAREWQGRPVARTVAEVAPRRRAVLVGVVTAAAANRPAPVRRRVGTATRGPSFDATLDDGTGSIVVRWVGRDAVPGVRPGVTICVEGTVAELRQGFVLLNPLYRFGVGPARDGAGPGETEQDGATHCDPAARAPVDGRFPAALAAEGTPAVPRDHVAPRAAAQDGSSVS